MRLIPSGYTNVDKDIGGFISLIPKKNILAVEDLGQMSE
jgi:hypothetical protein